MLFSVFAFNFNQHFTGYLCCRFKDISTLYPVTKRPDLEKLLLDQGGDWTPVVTDWLTHLIKKGLGKRVKMVCPEPQIPVQVRVA